MIKIKSIHILANGVEILYMFGQSHKNFSVGVFKWVKDTSEFSNDFIENYEGNGDDDYLFESDI